MSLSGHNTNISDSQPTLGLPVAAPVLEYVCLFTHDLKRKQKRWQDGRLKFHTFNKRVMVYDERGNFIGDMHWREDFDFGEGEEFNLERGAVIVQVAECVGTKDQDLTGLLDKRAREAEQRYARTSVATANSTHLTVRPPVVPNNHSQTPFRQRHLAEIANTSRGLYGRAVMPIVSPYEERIAAQQSINSPEGENQRPTKRRRDISPPSKSGYAQNLFGATLNLSSWSASAPLRHQPAQTYRNAFIPERTPKPGVPSRNVKPSWPRPSEILDRTGDGLVQVEQARPSSATTKRDHNGTIAETSPKRNALVPTSFKLPGMGNIRNEVIQGEDQIPTEPEETLVVNSHQPQYCMDNPGNTAAKQSARKSQDAMWEPILHHSAARSSNGALFDSAVHRVSAEVESPEQRDGIVKDVGTSVLQPLADGSLLRLARDTGQEEPKSKLRIKARKKRGLLMVAKNTTAKTSDRQPDSPGVRIEAPPTEKQLMTVHTLEPKAVNCDDSQSSGEPAPSRVKLREHKTQPRSGLQRDVEMTTQSGPRLASLGRRSVKSMEIIGSFDPRKCRAAAESPPATSAPREKNIISPKTDSGESSSTKVVESRSEEKATYLTNPATRGRKAAKKSDAAGSVPQSVLSVIPDLAVGKNDRRDSRREVTLDSIAVLGGKTAREVPGFSRASGGPWSKEAYDLLGCIRPG
ncbi:hypothetical protein LY76DRAFT_309503 [Colletotrichum caudatum]|nr:hypothetical protein LY76DRAFT_309503 [Colletotrichum caudatum]